MANPRERDTSPAAGTGLPFAIVGIGASAGGLQAVKRFLEQMPADSGMAFVIIFHLSPDHQSYADKLLQDITAMPVIQVSDTLPIEPNHVYVISPAHDLAMGDGHLRVSQPQPRRGGQVAIDLFFRNLADVHRERAFCVVLSGTGSDGAVGLSRIKEQGGVTLVQAPDDAEFDGMPNAAIATQMVDFVLPVAQLPGKILELWRNARQIVLPADSGLATLTPANEREAALAEHLVQEILIQLRLGTGHDFKHYKRATVLRRIERRLQVTAQPDLRAYYQYLLSTPGESKALLDDMLIGVTNFFRDREAFDALERDVLPQLFTAVDAHERPREEVRVWSAGTSTGEEAYTLAMMLNDQQLACGSAAKIQVFATDIDDRAVAVGRAGAYPHAIVADIPPGRLRQYFIREENASRVRKEIREKVLFAKHSLLVDPPFSQIDLIVCRNLLIYLDRDVQREILQMFHFALNPGGYLFLGSSESVDLCPELFTPLDKKNRIFRAKTGAPVERRLLSMPRGGYIRPSNIVSAPAAPVQRKLSFADIHQRAVERSMPPSMIVDSNSDIMHMSEGAGRFLRHAGGEVTRNLLNLAIPQLRLELRTALFQVHQSAAAVRARQVELYRDNAHFLVDITAYPYTDKETESECVLLVFAEQEVDAAQVEAGVAVLAENQVLANLERDLQRTKLQLQDTIEQSEISSEELKASNEEMQAINEELRSATEELETSKEELQSINEELLTVNTELKTKVEETDKINDYLTNLIASTDIATVFVDRTMRIKWFTPRATDIFSMLPVDTGRSLLDITHRLAYDEMVSDARTVFETLSTIEREVSSIDGRWYIARLLPYRSCENYIDGMVLTFIDITKRRAAEEELRLGEERLRLVQNNRRYSLGDEEMASDLSGHADIYQDPSQATQGQTISQLKDEFFAVMSHELKHPLNLIQLNAEMLRRLPMLTRNSIAAKAVDAIHDGVVSQVRIIDDLLDVARVRTGKLQLKRATVSLGTLVREVCAAVTTGDGPRLLMELPDPAHEPLLIDADATRIEQIIWNLLGNALKFTPADGQVQVIASRHGDDARLEVVDNGLGIARDQLHSIFELFSQADTAHSRQHREGLGIGLSLVRQLAEAHGGSVKVHSAGLGQGSRFTVLLPLSFHEPEAPEVLEESADGGRLVGLKVLLVDDSPQVLEALALLLEMEAAKVSAFTVPEQALAAAAQGSHDLVVCDIGMPGMDGHQLMAALRRLPAYQAVPSIALTGYGTTADVKAAQAAGFSRHMSKPVAFEAFIETIEALCRLHS